MQQFAEPRSVGLYLEPVPALAGAAVARWVFFSSRRRHTILSCYWSSDVCSSDLAVRSAKACGARYRDVASGRAVVSDGAQIGRASCRERGEISGVALYLKKN